MIAQALAWLAASKAGRIAAAIGAAILAIGAALLMGRREGRQAAQAEQAKETIKVQEKVNEAAAAYRADGARQRLRDGTF